MLWVGWCGYVALAKQHLLYPGIVGLIILTSWRSGENETSDSQVFDLPVTKHNSFKEEFDKDLLKV